MSVDHPPQYTDTLDPPASRWAGIQTKVGASAVAGLATEFFFDLLVRDFGVAISTETQVSGIALSMVLSAYLFPDGRHDGRA